MSEERATTATRKPQVHGDGWKEKFLAALAVCGTVLVACKKAGVHRCTAYRERKNDADFAQAWDDAIEDAIDSIEFTGFKMAVGSSGRPAKDDDPGEEPTPPDGAMIRFFLQTRRKRVYGNTQRIEHTGDGGGPIVHSVEELLKLPLSELVRVYRAALGASPEAQP